MVHFRPLLRNKSVPQENYHDPHPPFTDFPVCIRQGVV